MRNQAPAKVVSSAPAASNTNTSSNNKALLDDPTFQAIHNAFLLGWNLMELKSRVQTVGCILSLNREDVIDALKKQLTSTQLDSQSQSGSQTQPQAAAQTQPQADQNNLLPINSLLENVVLKDIIQAQSNKSSTEKSLSTELRDNIWLTSVLRAIFMQIVALHVKRFPDSDTTDTIYNLPASPLNANDLKNYPYPYLYPFNGKFDYANVGIRKIKEEDVGNNNIDIDSFVQKFSLYDVTRRALNCLTLLLTTSEDSLISETIKDYQQELVQQVLAPQSTSTEPNSSNQKPSTQAGLISRALTSLGLLNDDQKLATQQTVPVSNAGQPSKNKTDQDNNRKAAIKKLSNLVIPLLEAWDSFLRESFYVDTNSQNDNPGLSSYEIELVAYEAGRSLAALSWGVSVALVPLENLENIDTLLKIEDEQAKEKGLHPLKDVLTKKVQNTWMNVFNDRDVNHVQHQIVALSTTLDEAFYRVHTDVKPPKPDDPLAPPNPDLPSQALQTVKHSLDYWERAIALMCEKKKPLLEPMPAKAQPQGASAPSGNNTTKSSSNVPLNSPYPLPQENTPTVSIFPGDVIPTNTDNQLVDRTPRPSKPLDWELSKTLRTELIQQSTAWQSLILCQQGLRSFTVETVTQKILNDFMKQLETAAGQEIFNSGAFKWTLGIIIGIILALIGLIGLVTLVLRPSSSILMSIMSIINSPPVIITTIVTAIGAIATPFVNGFLGKLSKIGSFFGSAGTAVETALQDGYEQILIEFGYLNHNIGVSFPLIEFFVLEEIEFKSGEKPAILIEDGYDFLVNVFWTARDREEELQRVARAAFGPIGTFVGASLKLGDNGSQQTSSSPSSSKNGSK